MSANWTPGRLERAILQVMALAALVSAAPATACTVRIGTVAVDKITYDPFVSAGVEGTIRMAIDLVDGDSCDSAVILTDDSAVPLRTLAFGPDGGVVFRPQLQRAAGVREGTDPAEALVALTTASPHAELTWRLISEDDAILPPGEYTAPIRVQTRDAAQSVAPALGSVTLRSIARAQINLAGTAGAYEAGSDAATIDLGELHTGGAGRAYLQMRANTPATISFVSGHRGYLVHSASGNRIAYRLRFDGTEVALEQPAAISVAPSKTLRGSSFELAVTVGEVTGATAGRYEDTIVIDVSP